MEMPTVLPSGGLRDGVQPTQQASWGGEGWIPPGWINQDGTWGHLVGRPDWV